MSELTDKISKIEIESKPSVFDDAFPPGHLLGGKYRVISQLGKGGVGSVYRVQQIFLNKEFALKTLDTASVSNVTLQRFQLEAKAAASLNHPNLVQVNDFGLLDEGKPYLVMELVDGTTFAEYLKRNGPIDVQQVPLFFSQACFGLLAAHEQGIVHRDIKPGNIMVVNNLPFAADGKIKVVDFGIAKLTSRESGEIQALTRTGEIFGSPLYMSPEQCVSGVVDHRSDIYSLGCVLFEMLTGTPPHMGQTALATMILHDSGNIPTLREASLGKEFPDALEHIVAKMLRKSPSERYQNAGLVAHDLAEVCAGGKVADLRPIKKVKKPDKMITMKVQSLLLLIVLTAAISASTAGFVGYLLRQAKSAQVQKTTKPLQSNDDTAKQSLDKSYEFDVGKVATEAVKSEQDADAVAELKNAGPVRATLVHEGRDKQLTFPDCGIGLLCKFAPYDTSQTLCDAKGTVSMPRNLPLTLKVQGKPAALVLDTPEFFAKIDPNIFLGLVLTGADRSLESTMLDVQTKKTASKNLESILTTAAGWSHLDSLALNYLQLDAPALTAISKSKQLRNLELNKCVIDQSRFARQSFLKQLKSFSLVNMNVGGLVIGLARSANLEHVCLGGTGLTAETIHQLRNCPRLDFLMIQAKTIDDQVIQAISEIKSLRTLMFEGKLSIEQIKTLIQCPRLEHIILYSGEYSNDDVRYLKSLNHKIHFTISSKNDSRGGIVDMFRPN